MNSVLDQKTVSLLSFLKDTVSLRQKRVTAYRSEDKVLWFARIPTNRPGEIRSAFFADNSNESPDFWLEVHKQPKPTRPPEPKICKDWVRPQDLDQADQEPELLPKITVLVERETPNPYTLPGSNQTLTEQVPEERRLEDHPEVQDAWREYLLEQWKPWAQKMHSWQEVQQVYEEVDFMRRRLEEAEERYELVLAVGLLLWRDSTNTPIKRHLLTAPAEIHLDADRGRGVLTVGSAASFEQLRVELDMLALQDQPRLEGTDLNKRLEELDDQVWNRSKVGEILRVIANYTKSDAQVEENTLDPPEREDDTLRVVYAPALVLRERRSTAYQELVNHFLEEYNSGDPLPLTPPWECFISEGEEYPSHQVSKNASPDHSLSDVNRLYFPLPTNEEQRKIIERLKAQPYVIVKGPPGTGKSHTIANLICHLLALGNSVLVTAHTSKALTVLRELIPSDIRHLCVTTLGSTSEDQRLLEDSVRRILSRKNEWKREEWAKQIDELERELSQLEDECIKRERKLRKYREAETHSTLRPGGYQGTPAQIAKQLDQERSQYDWFPQLSDYQTQCPLDDYDLEFLANIHSQLTEERVKALSLNLGDFLLPSPDQFRQLLLELEHTAKTKEEKIRIASGEKLAWLQHENLPTETLHKMQQFLEKLEEASTKAARVLGENKTLEILEDLLVGQRDRWISCAQDLSQRYEPIEASYNQRGKVRVDLPTDIPYSKVLADTKQRLDYFARGGRRGFWIFTPRIVRETQYIERSCLVDGEYPREPQLLEKLLVALELRRLLDEIAQAWPDLQGLRHPDLGHRVESARSLQKELDHLLSLFNPKALNFDIQRFPPGERKNFAQPEERNQWLKSIQAEIAIRRNEAVKKRFKEWQELIRSVDSQTAHPWMHDLAQAIEEYNAEKWQEVWEVWKRFKEEHQHFNHYQKLVGRLEEICPDLGNLLRSHQGNPEWRDRILQMKKAWAHSSARAWLRYIIDNSDYEHLNEERHRLQKKIEKKTEQLAALKAWQAFFHRLDKKTEQNLKAWEKAIRRIGKGTGKYAYRHRRSARQYLDACIPKIPAWIMPLHKLWETVKPEAGVFDTIIVDEASQAGIESLPLLLLAKRIIIVGDDMQNSPEAVGVLEDDMMRLARDHLGSFHFLDEFRPDTSLFDHAERAFGTPISLREHFRCVPEIIHFSNQLCYTSTPLIPLRQPPPHRLPPLKTTFVEEGNCEGEGQRIMNRAEAERIVETIQKCLADEAYKDKSMGVIVLQGHAQAELIARRLAEVLDPKDREARRLRCGVPATFQGDQRDVIFLSLVLAPNHPSRALTEIEAQRRFNVAMSRARDQVWLFHSVREDDLGQEDLRRRLLNFFYNPDQEAPETGYEELDRLEREAKRYPHRPGEQPDPYESWFEVDVALELLRRGYQVSPQYPFAGYRIDLVITGGSKRLAVECDGDAWHGPERFDQDMTRQRQLERAGWTFVRIRESEFYIDRIRAMKRVLEKCEEIGIYPLSAPKGWKDENPPPSSVRHSPP